MNMRYKWFVNYFLFTILVAPNFILIRAFLQCQSAALDELFGKPGACFPRYQTAQILFHSLAQHTEHPQDKNILGKCKWSIESNLIVV